MTDRLEPGAILLIDYGRHRRNVLPRSQNVTLQTYQAPRTAPARRAGETDITADVDFTALMDLHPTSRLVRQG